jgi:hypothetical protein
LKHLFPIECNCATGALCGRTETAKALETERTVAIITVTRLAGLAEAAERTWREPDPHLGNTRRRTRVRDSAALCQVTVDRAAAIAERLGLPGPRCPNGDLWPVRTTVAKGGAG